METKIPNIDDIEEDELESVFLSILPPDVKAEYITSGSDVGRLQIIIDFLTNFYLPFFENDQSLENLLTEINILVDVNDPSFELSADLVNAIVELSVHVRNEADIPEKLKNNFIIILTHMFELIDD